MFNQNKMRDKVSLVCNIVPGTHKTEQESFAIYYFMHSFIKITRLERLAQQWRNEGEVRYAKWSSGLREEKMCLPAVFFLSKTSFGLKLVLVRSLFVLHIHKPLLPFAQRNEEDWWSISDRTRYFKVRYFSMIEINWSFLPAVVLFCLRCDQHLRKEKRSDIKITA